MDAISVVLILLVIYFIYVKYLSPGVAATLPPSEMLTDNLRGLYRWNEGDPKSDIVQVLRIGDTLKWRKIANGVTTTGNMPFINQGNLFVLKLPERNIIFKRERTARGPYYVSVNFRPGKIKMTKIHNNPAHRL